MNLCRCITIDISIGFITLYNSIIAVIDLFVLIVSIILLSDGKENLGDIVGIIFLIYALIALPCVICGICYVWSLFHIQNNLRIARFFGFCNFIMMIFTLFIIYNNSILDVRTIGFGIIFFIINLLSLLSILYLCFVNCGYVEEINEEDDTIESNKIKAIEMPQVIEMKEQHIINIPEVNNNNNNNPSAPLESEGNITIR